MAISAAALSCPSGRDGGGADLPCSPPDSESDRDSPPVPSGQPLERGHA